MAITTYAELQTAVANWLGRTDLTTRVPEFIDLAEVKLSRELSTRDMETKTVSLSVNAEYVPLPADFNGVRYFELGVSPRRMLTFMPLETQTQAFETAGTPKTYCVVGGNFRFGPTPDTTYTSTLIYYASIPQLSTTQTTNWLLTKHPDVYLYGTLLEAEAFLRDDPRLQIWKAGYDEGVRKITANSNFESWSGPAMATRAERVA